jgi:hypothetical protein
MGKYEDDHGELPPAAIRDKSGVPLLSWRVAILPDLAGKAIYREMHLDESWDSPHNLQFLDKMPSVFRSPGQQPPQAGSTFYRVFTGPGTAFERDGLRLTRDFPNGTSNTIGVIEAGEAVPWTKPDELEYHPGQPLPSLGGIFRSSTWLDRQRDKWDGFQAAMMDGSVQRFDRNYDDTELRKFIVRNSGSQKKRE